MSFVEELKAGLIKRLVNNFNNYNKDGQIITEDIVYNWVMGEVETSTCIDNKPKKIPQRQDHDSEEESSEIPIKKPVNTVVQKRRGRPPGSGKINKLKEETSDSESEITPNLGNFGRPTTTEDNKFQIIIKFKTIEFSIKNKLRIEIGTGILFDVNDNDNPIIIGKYDPSKLQVQPLTEETAKIYTDSGLRYKYNKLSIEKIKDNSLTD